MPAKSEKQRRFMGAELFRARAGKKTQTGMSESKISEFASKSMDAINTYLKKQGVPIVADSPKLCPFPGCEKGYWNTRAHNLLEHGGRKPIGGWKGDEQITREQFDVLAKPNIAEREKAEEGLKKSRVPNGNTFAKSMNLIDAYLFKHGHVLPCGHHAEEGADIDKACTSGGCGAMGGTSVTPYRESGTNTGRSGTVYAPSTDNVPSGIHLPSGGSGSSGGATGSGTMTSSSPPEGGFRRSADSIKLINRYLNKQSRHKCGHKKGDPNHLEAA